MKVCGILLACSFPFSGFASRLFDIRLQVISLVHCVLVVRRLLHFPKLSMYVGVPKSRVEFPASDMSLERPCLVEELVYGRQMHARGFSYFSLLVNSRHL